MTLDKNLTNDFMLLNGITSFNGNDVGVFSINALGYIYPIERIYGEDSKVKYYKKLFKIL